MEIHPAGAGQLQDEPARMVQRKVAHPDESVPAYQHDYSTLNANDQAQPDHGNQRAAENGDAHHLPQPHLDDNGRTTDRP